MNNARIIKKNHKSNKTQQFRLIHISQYSLELNKIENTF